MNGRIYDPLIGRFLGADMIVQYPYDLQSFNRFSYVRNNPLTRIDPTGFADLNLTTQSDPAHVAGDLVPRGGSTGTYYTIAFHGAQSGGFYADSAARHPISTEQIINALNSNGHARGQPIEAIVCWSGTGANLTQMQRVAAATDSPIIAALGIIAPVVTRSGRMLQPQVTDAADNVIRDASGGRAGRVVIQPDGTVAPYDPSHPVAAIPQIQARPPDGAVQAAQHSSNQPEAPNAPASQPPQSSPPAGTTSDSPATQGNAGNPAATAPSSGGPRNGTSSDVSNGGSTQPASPPQSSPSTTETDAERRKRENQ